LVEEVRLKVAEAKQRDAGRGKVRIDDDMMKTLGITAGDAIEITGKRKTAAVAWPAYDEDKGRDVIRADGLVRKNAGVGIGEYVTVRKADVKEAQGVVLAPVDMRLNVDTDFINLVKKRLLETPLVNGDSVFVVILGSAIPFIVESTEPQGVVRITGATNLKVLSQPGPSPEEKTKRLEEKRLVRFAWLKEMEKRCASDYTRFRVPELVEDEKEEPVLDEAKKKARDTNGPVKVFVDFWERRGKIGSFDWASVQPDGAVEYVYDETVGARLSDEEVTTILSRLEKQLEAIAEKLKTKKKRSFLRLP